MGISDWSSDVCSSDLLARGQGAEGFGQNRAIVEGRQIAENLHLDRAARQARRPEGFERRRGQRLDRGPVGRRPAPVAAGEPTLQIAIRSEEHTSELQSLMRISYAVFCLKKQNK